MFCGYLSDRARQRGNTLSEITLAFVTVIFLLSDFISLKESIRRVPGDQTGAELEKE
jgi:hypothetical protein